SYSLCPRGSSIIYYTSAFCLHTSLYHRYLPSFPTRRSSDLDLLFQALSQNGQNRFMVGDVKQSIYSFRQAMPHIFLGYRENMGQDRKSTRLNSSHVSTSYAVSCLNNKNCVMIHPVPSDPTTS